MTASGSAVGDRPTADLALPRPPGVLRRFLARHPRILDWVVAGIHLLAVSPVVIGGILEGRAPVVVLVQIVVAVATAAALLQRRTRPLLALGAAAASTLVSAPVYGQSLDVPLMFALYAAAVYRSARSAWIGLAVGIGVGVTGELLGETGLSLAEPPAPTGWITDSLFLAVVMLVAVLIGTNVGARRRYLAALVDRAAQLARERDQQAQLAAAAERARIAREMHDVVAHSLSIVIALADGALARLDTDPRRSRDAIERVADTGRDALADMRRLLGMLGETEAALQPQPRGEDLAALIDDFRQAGLPVECAVSGPESASAGRQLSVHRIVQESLTNTLRHARGVSRVTVEIAHETEQTVITVTDDGAPRPAPGDGDGGGRGIRGMRERAALYGGELIAGPVAGGGWRVRAVLRDVQ